MEKFKLRIEKRKKNDGGGKWGSKRGRELIIWRRFDVCERRIHSNATKGRNDWNEEEEGRKGEQGEKNSRRDSMRDEKWRMKWTKECDKCRESSMTYMRWRHRWSTTGKNERKEKKGMPNLSFFLWKNSILKKRKRRGIFWPFPVKYS